MTHFESPALRQPELRLNPTAMRGLLAVAAASFTAVLWFAVGSQAGQFGGRETTPRVTLPPVVVSAVRSPAASTVAMGAAAAGAECDRSVPGAGPAGRIPVNLNQ